MALMWRFFHNGQRADRLSILMHNALIKSRNERIRDRLAIYHSAMEYRKALREFGNSLQIAVNQVLKDNFIKKG